MPANGRRKMERGETAPPPALPGIPVTV